eukprot:CAMPEP_0173431896 /NCGR_PEP_ID=MMETSP1357-20121228/9881_1 /TAXON_ID=77926 /ORGANISM="Hemiselmis rufescens, Strain PCC563" /LENGTH=36 /DNA_ID= /DNA_START= /DNA_END= /DNA_ORIENTATION=
MLEVWTPALHVSPDAFCCSAQVLMVLTSPGAGKLAV